MDLFMDSFDYYGSDETKMLEGFWAEMTAILSTVHVRTGTHSLRFDDADFARRVLPAESNNIIVSFGLFLEGLPPSSERMFPIQFRTGANTDIATLTIRPDGVLELRSGSEGGTILGVTTGPVIVAGSFHHIECEIFVSDTAGTFELRVDEIVVMNLTTLNLGTTNIAQIAMGYVIIGGNPPNYWIDDLIVRDTTGTFNNTFQGDLRVATLQPIADGVNQGWATRSVQKLGIGVANFQDTAREMSVTFNDAATLEIGSQDFAIEGFVRFDTALLTTDFSQIFGKFLQTGDQRSWRLLLNGPDVGGTLVFETSALGTAADVVEVHAFPFVPDLNRYYHIAVARQGTTSRMFLDGQQIGIDQTDSRTYFDGTARLMVNSEEISTGDGTLTDSGISGWMDGVRLTIGAARYTANFVPPTDVLPITVGGDPLYNSVALLLNFDTGVVGFDESVNAFSGAAIDGAATEFPDDAVAFQNIDGETPNDFDFVEASLINATGTYSMPVNALDTETVVIGGTTYILQTVLVDVANNVLIGADAETTLDNLLAAVNLEAGIGTLYGTGTVQNIDALLTDLPDEQVLATARTPGAVGNAVVTTTTVTGASWGAATLLGGLDIPPNSEFTFADLPPEVTGIRSVALIGRNFKTDAGVSSMTMSFVEQGGALVAGAARSLTISPVYYLDIFETDPSTSGAITPSTLVGARIRLDRIA